MLGSSVLDVAIGMTFIYLLLSLIASIVQESLAALVQARAANLEHGIRSLFSGGKLGDHYFVDLLYRHGLIRGLYQDPRYDSPESDPSAAPIEPKQNLLRGLLRRFLRIRPTPPIPGISDMYLLPSYIPARTFALTMMDLLNPDIQNGKPALQNIEHTLHRLRDHARAATPASTNKAAEAMLALINDAGNAEDAAERFRGNLEDWYSDAMDRVSGWYKRYTQKILLVIGLAIAIVFNVDSIRVGRTLWFDHDARQGLAAAAGSYVQKNTSAREPEADKRDDDKPVQAPDAELSQKDLTDRMKTTVRAFNDVSSEYLLPVGWRYSFADYRHLVRNYPAWNLIHILEQLTGWVITAFALSLGAPFWFDLLNKFMVVRNTVKPHEKSRPETSKG